MEIIIGLLIIAAGAFCQSSSYVPINKIKSWSWETYWLVQGVFAWLVFPILGALLAVPEGHSLFELFTPDNRLNVLMTMVGQSIALGTCAALGTILGPVLLHAFFPEQGHLATLTASVLIGVGVTLVGIAVIGVAGSMKASSLSDEEKKAAVKDFNFPKGITIALLSGFMSGCFNIGLEFGKDINFGELTPDLLKTLPATLLVTIGGFVTNAAYCLYQNAKNRSWGDYRKKEVWANNLVFCALAGILWYSQFFGLSIGKGFLTSSPTLTALAFCILMALDVVFSNVWGIILKEWKGCSKKTIMVLAAGIAILVVATFLPQFI